MIFGTSITWLLGEPYAVHFQGIMQPQLIHPINMTNPTVFCSLPIHLPLERPKNPAETRLKESPSLGSQRQVMETTSLSSVLALPQKAELSRQSVTLNGVLFFLEREMSEIPAKIRFRNYTNLPRLFFVFLFFRQQKGEWSMVPLMVGLVNCVACFFFLIGFAVNPHFTPFWKGLKGLKSRDHENWKGIHHMSASQL